MLVVLALVLGLVDFFVWGLMMSLGPGGLAGDRTPTELELLNAKIANAAALVACTLGLAAPLSVLVTSGTTRTKTLLTMVALQLVGTAALFVVLLSA